MVPSTGLRTALKAVRRPWRMAWARSATVHSLPLASHSPSATPRSIWLVMTPELPRAPMSEPWVMAFAMSSIEAPAGSASTSFTTVPNVSDMLVPVSPSGTGKTLSLLISSARSAMTFAAAGKHVRMESAIMGKLS
jgi:hypothetical protein